MDADNQDKNFKYKELTAHTSLRQRSLKFSTGFITNWVTDFWKGIRKCFDDRYMTQMGADLPR
ncbi:hypothetical protein CH333_10095 [candidate division WOR-3 bacterium JGI_Cruoil_03_44_89]|uniref:Uncharacterized protein n=1 Tax=candidate division WOR-3 bacterium JGI_Cruoil_03_44_89 TaxID=1973748 RepID=A0A235BN38_UNCW3|nr:MAG: hypothetical protein CH333_10095 [candidate division WOR-3 bacterium JGI_Cruoil_03_44_89]